MNWVTVIWSMVASACLTLAAMNLLIWLRQRTAWANLLISVMATGTAVTAFFELSMMFAETPQAYGRFIRWIQIPLWVVVVSLVLFIRQYLRSGRPWLAWTVCGLRTLSLVLNFVFAPSIHYRVISSLQPMRFLGDTIVVANGVVNPWMLTAQASTLLLVAYVVDAALTVRRKGGSRSAILMSWAIIFFVASSMVQAALVFWWRLPMPITISFFSLGVVVTTAYEMSLDVQRAAQLSEDLRASEARLRDITFSMADWVWEVDEKRLYTYSSAKGNDLFGRVIGKTPFDLMPPEETERVASLFSESAAKKAPIKDLENWYVRKDGERICLLTNGVPILDEAGKLKGYRGVNKDITERKSMEESLRTSEEKFREFFKNTPDYCYIISPEGTILNINHSALQALGYEREELLGKPLSMIYESGSYRRMKELFAQWPASGQIRNEEMIIITKQGEKRTVLLNVGAVKDKEGRIIYSTSVQTDITERKRAEEALQKSEERILALVENTSDLIWSVDAKNFGLLTFNSALRNYFFRGHGLEIRVGMTPDQMLPQEYAAQWREFYARALREGPFVIEYLTSAKTHILLLSINCLKIRGEVFGISVFGRDITERKRAEEALEENEAALRNSKKDLQRLAGRLISAQEEELRRLSRELHDDLTQRLAVLAIEAGKLELDLNKMPDRSPDRVHTVAQIKDQLIKVSEDVHTISRQLHPTILDDLGLVRAIESECSAVMGRHPVGIVFRKENVPDEISDDIALCLYRVVQEGLRNITAHSEAKNCEIFLKGGDHAILLTVSDDGVGFDPVEVRSMPGLGLSSMRERVQLIEGDFAIRSQTGKGVLITVRVPLAGGVA